MYRSKTFISTADNNLTPSTWDNLKNSVDLISVDFLNWLALDWGIFPECCDVSSLVLGGYIKRDFPSIKIMAGKYSTDLGKSSTHYWLSFEGKIIDFTLFQFYLESSLSSLDGESLLKNEIKNLQGSVFVPQSFYRGYILGQEVENIFTAKCHELFVEYLDRVFKSEEFRERFSYGL